MVGALFFLGPLMLSVDVVFLFARTPSSDTYCDWPGWLFLIHASLLLFGIPAHILVARRFIQAHPEHTFVIVMHASAMALWFLLTGAAATLLPLIAGAEGVC